MSLPLPSKSTSLALVPLTIVSIAFNVGMYFKIKIDINIILHIRGYILNKKYLPIFRQPLLSL
jgi:hypothetical protein